MLPLSEMVLENTAMKMLREKAIDVGDIREENFYNARSAVVIKWTHFVRYLGVIFLKCGARQSNVGCCGKKPQLQAHAVRFYDAKEHTRRNFDI
jgi:hypothetical protein